ncbi:hypothetical protein ASG52_05380 [Methylobacterium sp. Leaf456]|nr:hypothetical protein ASG52_05380 [Methylobacterium sp. Leaf456]
MLNTSTALHSVAYAVDVLSDPRAMPRSAVSQGTAATDNVTAGEVFVVFADANPRRGYLSASVYIRDILAIPRPPGATPHRNPRASSISRHIGQAVLAHGANRPSVEQRQRALVELAAAILDEADRSRLQALTGCVPVVAIVGDTRAAGLTSGRFYHAVTTLPGTWLGTSAPTGRA